MAAIRKNLVLLRRRVVGSHGILFLNDMDELTSCYGSMSCKIVRFHESVLPVSVLSQMAFSLAVQKGHPVHAMRYI
jgi:hypothetical protein